MDAMRSGSSSETIDQTFDRLQKLITQLEIQGEVITQEDMNLKLLRSLPSEWKTHALIWRNKQEIETISLDDLYNNLKIYEPEISGSSSTSQNPQNVAFVSSNSTNSNSSTNEADNTAYGVSAAHTQSNPASGDNLSDAVICAFLASQPNSPQMSREDLEQIDPDDLEEMDLHRNSQADITRLGDSSRGRQAVDCKWLRVGFDSIKSGVLNCMTGSYHAEEEHPTLLCIDGHTIFRKLFSSDSEFKTRLGYNAASSIVASPVVESFVNSSEMLENQENNKSKYDKGYHAVPPPFTWNFMPRKPNLMFMDEIVKSENLDVTTVVTPNNVKAVESNHESANVKNNSDAVEPKTVRKNSFRPLVIEDWNSDDESEGQWKKMRRETTEYGGKLELQIKMGGMIKPQEVSLKGYFNKKSRLYILIALIVLILLVHLGTIFKYFLLSKIAFTLLDVPNVFSIDDIGIFGNAYDDEDVGAEADLNNLETTMNVSPIPTTRIDKDHPKDQIIGDLNSAIQTRRMTKISDEHAMNVWILVNLPNGKRAIGTKWVFRNKKNERGIVIRNKARLVAQGYTQEQGIDYDEVFAPIARIEAIRLFLAYASFIGFIVYQMDVKSAFLYGTIEEDVYVCQSPCFEDPQFPDKVYKVEKALYGLHQAPRAWYETLSTYLIKNRFRRGTIDKNLFIKKDKGDILLVQVYVDDIIFGSTKKSLCDEFEDKYVAEILKKFDFATMKTTSTPMKPNKALVKDEEADTVDVHLYKSMIGSLMYLTASRPDIMFAVCACARDSPFDLEAFFDSDYAGASLDMKSTTGGCQFLGKRLISWQ
ncbi:putative ribonuclease H-like domain-containing protein, partial [Tanacetum coccineum]